MKRVDIKNVEFLNSVNNHITLPLILSSKHEPLCAIIRFIVSRDRDKMKGQN